MAAAVAIFVMLLPPAEGPLPWWPPIVILVVCGGGGILYVHWLERRLERELRERDGE